MQGYFAEMGHAGLMDVTPETESLEAVLELLALGRKRDLGITFRPESSGWMIGYIDGNHGDFLAEGSDLAETAKAAIRAIERADQAL